MAAFKYKNKTPEANLEEELDGLCIDKKRDINILLFGETGVGKSTFINAFCNYLRHHDLKYATKNKPLTLIPAKFTITDEDYLSQTVEIGADDNEFKEVGASATQYTKSYVFPIRRGSAKVRLIDTPGIADTRGVTTDNTNFENILDFIAELKYLSAICVLLKPNETRNTVQFEYCIKQLLSRLDKSACNNLVFVFTNSRSTFYRPGETLQILKHMFKGIQNVAIPLGKENIFCLDNEAFLFWAAYNEGVKFSDSDIENFSLSWKQSFRECWRMIGYIAGKGTQKALEPHLVKNTISINDARRLIISLALPLAEIAQLIDDNIRVSKRHIATLESNDTEVSELSRKLYIPVLNLKITELAQPTTVCTSATCSEFYEVNAVKKWHYKQKCHSPCYLRGVPKEIIGSPELAKCAAMDTSMGTQDITCKKCGCKYQHHMHIYFETKVFEDKVEDEGVKKQIKDKKTIATEVQKIIYKIELRLTEYKHEKETILKTTAQFAYFLQTNAITPYNDAYEGYLLYLIDREKSLGDHTDYTVIRELELSLNCYKEAKRILSNSMQEAAVEDQLTASDIIKSVTTLYELKYNGLRIKELLKAQKVARKDENKSTTKEFVYSEDDKTVWGKKNRKGIKTDSDVAKPKPFKNRKGNKTDGELSSAEGRYKGKKNTGPAAALHQPLLNHFGQHSYNSPANRFAFQQTEHVQEVYSAPARRFSPQQPQQNYFMGPPPPYHESHQRRDDRSRQKEISLQIKSQGEINLSFNRQEHQRQGHNRNFGNYSQSRGTVRNQPQLRGGPVQPMHFNSLQNLNDYPYGQHGQFQVDELPHHVPQGRQFVHMPFNNPSVNFDKRPHVANQQFPVKPFNQNHGKNANQREQVFKNKARQNQRSQNKYWKNKVHNLDEDSSSDTSSSD